MRCRISSVHLTLLQGFAVVIGVISILLLADAVFEDYKFNSLTTKVNHHNNSLILSNIQWINKEKTYYRGKLDWFLIIALVLITFTHASFLLVVLHEMSNRRRLKTRTLNQNNSVQVEQNEKVSTLEDVTSGKNHDDSKKIQYQAKVPSPTNAHQIQNNETASNQYKRVYQPKTFIFATAFTGLFGLILVTGTCLELHLVKQLDLFYNDFTTKEDDNVTWPFPAYCAFGKRSELQKYKSNENFQSSGFRNHGICNNYIMKLVSTGLSIVLAILSLTLTIFYWLQYKRLTNTNPVQNTNQFATSTKTVEETEVDRPKSRESHDNNNYMQFSQKVSVK